MTKQNAALLEPMTAPEPMPETKLAARIMPPTTAISSLIRMHGTCRPGRSHEEIKFITEWIDPLDVEIDAVGNRIKRIGDNPKVLYSCHTDTVHDKDGWQHVTIVDGMLRLTKRQRKKSHCLGADDTVGCWLMREMILAKRPGLYIFHRDEEGGSYNFKQESGSLFIANQTPHLLDGIKAAIAFDRKGTKSIITHQMMDRCCSEEFATSLGEGIGLGMTADDGGTFTDTANYTDLVGECTNVSVGYYNQHTKHEELDVAFALSLRDAMIKFDPDKLVFKREPGEHDPMDDLPVYDRNSYGEYDWQRGYDCSTTKRSKYADYGAYGDARGYLDDHYPATLSDLVREYPTEAADQLEACGIDAAEFEENIRRSYGTVRKWRQGK